MSTRRKDGAIQFGSENLRYAFLRAALEECSSSGPENVSFRAVGRRLGVTAAAPYYHFRDRGEILLLLAVEGYYELLERLKAAEAAAKTPQAKLAAIVRAYLEFGRQERGYYSLMFYREVVMPPNVLKLEEPAGQSFDLVSGVLKKLTPGLSLTHRSQRVVAIWSYLHGMLLLSAPGLLARRLAPEHEDQVAIEVCKRIAAS